MDDFFRKEDVTKAPKKVSSSALALDIKNVLPVNRIKAAVSSPDCSIRRRNFLLPEEMKQRQMTTMSTSNISILICDQDVYFNGTLYIWINNKLIATKQIILSFELSGMDFISRVFNECFPFDYNKTLSRSSYAFLECDNTGNVTDGSLQLDLTQSMHLYQVNKFALIFDDNSINKFYNKSSSKTIQLGDSKNPSMCLTSQERLFNAVVRRHFEAVAHSFESDKISIDEQIRGQWTPLHFSSKLGDFGITSYLLKRMANVDVVTENGWTPLHLACFHGHTSIVEVLIQYDADIKIRTEEGETCRDLVIREGHNVEEILEILDSVCEETDD